MGAPARRVPGHTVARIVALAFAVAACGASAPSVAPTARPTPVITPDPHLGATTTADVVFTELGRAGLKMTPNNASSGSPESDLVKRINATYLGWPLDITEYRTAEAAVHSSPWDPKKGPRRGDPPVAIIGGNIVVSWGPLTGKRPLEPEGKQLQAMADLVRAMDRILSPVRVRATVDVDVPGVTLAADDGGTTATSDETKATPEP